MAESCCNSDPYGIVTTVVFKDVSVSSLVHFYYLNEGTILWALLEK